MALQILATLVDSNNKALKSVSVDVCFYNLAGRTQRIASGRTLSNGQFKAQNSATLKSFLPRVVLRTQQNGKWVNLTNTPSSYSSKKLDFGTVKVSTSPVLTMASTAFYRIPTSVSSTAVNLSASNASTTQLKTLKTTNETLSNQLKASKKSASTLSSQIEQLKRAAQNSSQSHEKQRKENSLEINKLTQTNLDIAKQLKAKDLRILELEKLKPNAKPSIQTQELSKDEVISSAMEALNKADTQNKGRFQLRSAKMDLKVLPGSSKDKVRLIKDASSLSLIDPRLLSTLVLDLDINEGTEQSAAEVLKMPDLTGYTHSLASRRLDEMQLEAQWYNQQLPPEQHNETGKIISQTPKAGAPINDDAEIMLIIGVSPRTGA
ncbi:MULTISPECIES: PASTA domain-containing protein [unclassified Neptuniibacter]|uniref:PASTA domain-containing protein n=1 Tax=unclassified Neptuniibacter TaxID=2630693 RepID=UPI0025DFDE9D|nr:MULTISPECIES: PASTA domain-containing protein [unclassified Neptuniibacter]|tara:strand:+ start:19645 stop:20778 length:1134 start_codon:yes stop_codon:yes gene_type:complete